MSAAKDEHQVLSTRTIVGWSIGLGVVAVLSVVTLWTLLGSGGPHASVQLNIIRTAFSIVVGGGGAAALLLAARRQRATELDVMQRDHDATETRVTELYSRAADQLGSDKAPVRLAGIFALERLAQEHPTHRQTIVDLLCAYLRMPFDASDDPASAQERQVRQTAQGVLIAHARPDEDGAEPAHWPGMRLDLVGATLYRFTFTHCAPRSATFAGATFVGPTAFRGSTFEDTADFRNVRFTGLADFRRVGFPPGDTTFRGATFEGDVDFGEHTVAPLTGADTRTDTANRRKWPQGWEEEPYPVASDWARLVETK